MLDQAKQHTIGNIHSKRQSPCKRTLLRHRLTHLTVSSGDNTMTDLRKFVNIPIIFNLLVQKHNNVIVV